MRFKKTFIKFILVVLYCLILIVPGIVCANNKDKTMLMFIGENLDILTIASGKEESSWNAPAIVSVIEYKDIQQFHFRTLSEALSFIPGFHLPIIDSNGRSYLRGIPDSVLYLYDTVPLNFVGNKSLNLIHYALPLHAIKRIEIVRGPGSMLWGSDAFAGIVNVVPMTGNDFKGIETGALYSSKPGMNKLYLNIGHRNDEIASFLSISGTRMGSKDFTNDITRFWGDGNQPIVPKKRTGYQSNECEKYFEAYGNFSFLNDFILSARFTRSQTPYSLKSQNTGISWKEVRDIQSGFFKVEGKKNIDISTTVRFLGDISILKTNMMIIDKQLEQNEFDYYGEIIYEKALNSGHSLFTAGLSCRQEKNIGVPVWDSYLPGYLSSENTLFLPGVDQTDYTENLISIFTQYRVNIKNFDLIAGIRKDDHSVFKDNFSYNTGLLWTPKRGFIIKLLHGTAYRTPIIKQLLHGDNFDLEKIKNYSCEFLWETDDKYRFSICGFLNDIDNHSMDDVYAGLSTPNSQKVKGLEIGINCSPLESFSFRANMTLLRNTGHEEIYKYNDYSYLGSDGKIINHYINLQYPFDGGPDKLLNIMATWHPADDISCSLSGRFFSSYALAYPHALEYVKAQDTMTFDVGITFADLFKRGAILNISFKNIFNKNYLIPGMYSLEKGEPFSINIMLQKQW